MAANVKNDPERDNFNSLAGWPTRWADVAPNAVYLCHEALEQIDVHVPEAESMAVSHELGQLQRMRY